MLKTKTFTHYLSPIMLLSCSIARRKSRIFQEKKTFHQKGSKSKFFSSMFHIRTRQESFSCTHPEKQETFKHSLVVELNISSQTLTIIKYSACYCNCFFFQPTVDAKNQFHIKLNAKLFLPSSFYLQFIFQAPNFSFSSSTMGFLNSITNCLNGDCTLSTTASCTGGLKVHIHLLQTLTLTKLPR